MAIIGRWVQQLVLDTSSFTATLKEAAGQSATLKKDVEKNATPSMDGGKLKSQVTDTLKSLSGVDFSRTFDGLTGTLSKVAGAIGIETTSLLSKFSGTIGAVLSHPVARGAAIVLGALGAIGAYVKSTISDISSLVGMAKRLGVEFSRVQNLVAAASMRGVDTGTLTHAIEIMGRHASAVRKSLVKGGDTEDMAAFRRLGIAAEEVASLPVDQLFRRVAEGLSKVSNAADRAAYAQAIFSRSAREIMPLITANGEFFDMAAARAKKFGLAMSDIDANKLKEANVEMKKSGAAVESIVTSTVQPLAVALASTITFVSSLVTRAVELVQPVLQIIRDVIRWAGIALDAVIGFISPIVDALAESMGEIMDLLADAWNWISDIIGDLLSAIKDFLVLMGKAIGAVLRGLFAVFQSPLFKALRLVFGWIGTILGPILRSLGLTVQWITLGLTAAVEGFLMLLSKLPAWLGGNAFAAALKDVKSLREEMQKTTVEASRGVWGSFGRRAPQPTASPTLLEQDVFGPLGPQRNLAMRFREFARNLRSDAPESELLTWGARLQDMWRRSGPSRIDAGQQQTLTEDIDKSTREIVKQAAHLQDRIEGKQEWETRVADYFRTGARGRDLEEFVAASRIKAVLEAKLKIAEKEKTLRQQIATFHMDQYDREIYLLTHDRSNPVDESMVERLRGYQQEIQYLEFIKQMHDESRRVADGVKTPYDRFFDSVTNLMGLDLAGTLDGDTMALAMTRAMEELDKAMGQSQSPRAMLQGTVEAASTITQAMRANTREDPAQRMQRLMEASHAEQREQTRIARETRDAILRGDFLRAAEID